MRRLSTGALLASGLRKAGIPVRLVPVRKTCFPQPKRATESRGTSFAVTQSLRALEIPVARSLPGAEERLIVGRDCSVDRGDLVVRVGDRSLACRPTAKFLKTGAVVPAWWFSAYEELGGGTAWHDGLDDNGTYYWTVDLLRTVGKPVKVQVLGYSRNSTVDYEGESPRPGLRALVETSGLLDVEELTIYWNLLPVEGGRSPVVANLHFPVSPDELRPAMSKIAEALVRAKQTFDASRDYLAVWKYAVLDRAILY